jgi:hypothetical protein
MRSRGFRCLCRSTCATRCRFESPCIDTRPVRSAGWDGSLDCCASPPSPGADTSRVSHVQDPSSSSTFTWTMFLGTPARRNGISPWASQSSFVTSSGWRPHSGSRDEILEVHADRYPSLGEEARSSFLGAERERVSGVGGGCASASWGRCVAGGDPGAKGGALAGYGAGVRGHQHIKQYTGIIAEPSHP